MSQNEIKKEGIKLLVAGEFYTDSKPYFELIEKYKLNENVFMVNAPVQDLLELCFRNGSTIGHDDSEALGFQDEIKMQK